MLTCLQGLAAAGAAHSAVRGPAGRAGAGHAGPLPLQLQDSRNVADYEKHYEHNEHVLSMWPNYEAPDDRSFNNKGLASHHFLEINH